MRPYLATLFLLAFRLSAAEAVDPCQTYRAKLGAGDDLAVVFAIGPDKSGRPHHFPGGETTTFQDPESKMRREDVQKFGQFVLKNLYPNAQVYQPAKLTQAELNKTYAEIKARKPPFKRVLFITTAHGDTFDDAGEEKFFLRGDDKEKITDEALGKTMAGTPTETVLVACHSGAAKLKHFPGGVFGSARHGEEDFMWRFYHWMKNIYQDPTAALPTCASEFFESWKTARFPDDKISLYTRSPWVGYYNPQSKSEVVSGGVKGKVNEGGRALDEFRLEKHRLPDILERSHDPSSYRKTLPPLRDKKP